MSKITGLPLVVTAGILGLSVGAPLAVAGDATDDRMHDRHAYEHDGDKSSAIRDAWLHGKLESALLFNEHLNSFAIDTDVRQGTAYLKGVVESDIDKDLAGEIAASIDGVSDVRNELVVDKDKATMAMDDDDVRDRKGFKKSVLDATLTARVKTKLLLNSNTEGTDIDVDSSDGVVTLSGSVDSDQERDLAVQIAKNTEGTMSVNDNLAIDAEEEAE